MFENAWVVALQYGALAIIAIYLGYKDITINKKLLEVLTDIKQAFNSSVLQNKTLEESLRHERKRSEDCHAKIIEKLDEYFHRLQDCKE